MILRMPDRRRRPSVVVTDPPRDAVGKERELQPDPLLDERTGAWRAWVVALGCAAVVAIVFWGLNHERNTVTASAPPAASTGTSAVAGKANAPAGTTGQGQPPAVKAANQAGGVNTPVTGQTQPETTGQGQQGTAPAGNGAAGGTNAAAGGGQPAATGQGQPAGNAPRAPASPGAPAR